MVATRLLGACVLVSACGVTQGPKSRSSDFDAKKVYIGSETTFAHPSATGVLPDNEIDPPKRKKTPDARTGQLWHSVTELSSERVCVDFGSYLVSLGEMNDHLDSRLENARSPGPAGGYWIRVGNDERQLTVTEEAPNRVLDRRTGTYEDYEKRETGRMINECVEDLVNQYGTVVGCKRYEERPQVETVAVPRQGTIITRFGGFRACTPNDGFIGPTTPSFEIAFNGKVSMARGMAYRINLTGGTPVNGKWGATGGRSGLQPPGGAPNVASSTPKPSKPAGGPEEEVLRHATAKLKLVAFKVTGPGGSAKFELTADGKLMHGGQHVATYEANGVVRKPDGRAFIALDANGVIWVHKGGNVIEHAKISGNTLTLPQGTYTYDKGSFSSNTSGRGAVKYANRITPAIPPLLALFFIGTQNPNYFTKQK